ncbi:DNA translocase FtsK [Neorickettsia sennetsu]|uniref:Cell division protein FtsK n=1 Tax=Ehrlichia sennetsu (strain ATCC VR-367 / Miyayama) TaxID=222891 RepID=Q2GDB8_EHRS3|nr:DNA translocase FtsK [Neorickettsia sennetsu]ABD46147.1 putative cell division protein FtsK [Neorickettsia sennetsu str. Miyayama]
MAQKIKNFLYILSSITCRLVLLFLMVCSLKSGEEIPSFTTAAELHSSKFIFFGRSAATYLMTLIGLGFYPLCTLLVCSFILSREKVILLSVLILILITLLSKVPPSDEWLFGSYGGIMGSLLASYLDHPHASHFLIALTIILSLWIFNFLTIRKIKKAIRKAFCTVKVLASLPLLLLKKKLKSKSHDDKGNAVTQKGHIHNETPEEDLPIKCTYNFIKEKEPHVNEEDKGQTFSEINKKASHEVLTPTIKPKKKPSLKERMESSGTKSFSQKDSIPAHEERIETEKTSKSSSLKESSIMRKFTSHEIRKKFKSGTFAIETNTIPPLELLKERSPEPKQLEDTQKEGENLRKVLEDFKIECKMVEITVGPVVTLYELQPAAGIKSSSIIALSADVARTMSAISARISIIPGRSVIGVELPNKHREVVLLREILESGEYQAADKVLPIALGKSISGEPVVVDLAKMPHLLVAGTTGSGKSVAINTMILSLIYKLEPDKCKLIMIDPKMLELSIYNDIPHLLSPVVTDPKKAVVALKWVVKEMEERYRLMTKLSVRNIESYNKKAEEFIKRGKLFEYEETIGIDPTTKEKLTRTQSIELEKLPFIVVVVDEMADLMLVAGKEIETSIQRLAQMARASGIHIIMATQRPSVDIITGVIKANFPTRISFAVTSKIDSRTILGEQGAEQLLGRGDMLYMAAGQAPVRIHGPYVSDPEVEKIAEYLKKSGSPQYNENIVLEEESDEDTAVSVAGGDDFNSLYAQAIEIVRKDNKVSISYIQRRLSLGYNKAAKLVEKMEEEGVVSPPNNAGKRTLL